MAGTATKNNGILKVAQLLDVWQKQASGSEDGGPSSTHPTATADDKTEPGTEKAPGAENSTVLKEDNPKGPNEKVSQALAASRRLAGLSTKKADEPLTNVGASETGSKPEAETASAAGEGNDTGTTHPAEITNPELGGKYSSLRRLGADVDALGEKIAVQIISLGESAPVVPATSNAFQQGKQAAADVLDAPGGLELTACCKEAALLAHETANYLDMLKQSEGEMPPMDPGMDPTGGAGMAPPPVEGAAPGGGGIDPDLAALGLTSPEEVQALLSMLEGGGGAPAEPAAAEPQLEQLLASLGINSPEELQALIAQSQGGGAPGGEAPPAPGGEAPPSEPAPSAPTGDEGESEEAESSEPESKEAKAKGKVKKTAAVVEPVPQDVLAKVSNILRERLSRGNK